MVHIMSEMSEFRSQTGSDNVVSLAIRPLSPFEES